jgi:hypothetical protein
MNAVIAPPATHAHAIEISRRVRWDIDRDVLRGRQFDHSRDFLPGGLSLVDELPFLSAADQRLLSQVQGRTYACMFGLVERFIAAKVIDLAREHRFGDQVAFEALVRMTEEEIKHQALFRRMECMLAEDMPPGYAQTADTDAVAALVLAAPTWSVLALTLHIELFTQAHYRSSIEADVHICPLWKDVFLFHCKEEAQHTILDELEFRREDARLGPAQRDAAVDGLIALVGAVDAILQVQAKADAAYFCRIAHRLQYAAQVEASVLKAYRWQYIVSGAMDPRFRKVLFSLVDDAQGARIQQALAPLGYAVPRQSAFGCVGA